MGKNHYVGAAQAAPLPKEVEEMALLIGSRAARHYFDTRNNPTRATVTEDRLKLICAGAIATAIELLAEAAAAAHQAPPTLAQTKFGAFSRPVVIHLGVDGTFRYTDTSNLTAPVTIEGSLPLFSVDTVEQAKDLRVRFGRMKFGKNPFDADEPWYVLHRMPDGSAPPAMLDIKTAPDIAQMFAEWYEEQYGEKREVRRGS